MYCSNCGAKCLDGAQFCTECGQELIYTINQEGSEEAPVNHQATVNVQHSDSGHITQEKTPVMKIKFPVAGIFFILHGILLLYNYAMLMYSEGSLFIGGNPYFTLKISWISLLFLFGVGVCFLSKKIKLSSAAILLYSIWAAIVPIDDTIYSISVMLSIPDDHLSISSVFLGALANILMPCAIAFSYALLAFLAITVLFEKPRLRTIAKKFWYVPGCLFCLIFVIGLLRKGIYGNYFLVIEEIVCILVEILLSGWWLTNPYKVQNMPVYHPKPVFQRASSYDGNNMASETNPNNNPYDAPSLGYAVFGFFIPVAGLILYLVWREETPLRAKSAGKGALIGVIAMVGFTILMTVLSFVLPMVMLRGYY